ncbi:MAG: hypothetical protein QGM45_11125, partial [Anaerolineales bacterium]|nr:hypothetical protein [Anaerolineales bacterium]
PHLCRLAIRQPLYGKALACEAFSFSVMDGAGGSKVLGASRERKPLGLDIRDDIGEHVPDGRAEQRKNHDHDNCDQNKNQRILN